MGLFGSKDNATSSSSESNDDSQSSLGAIYGTPPELALASHSESSLDAIYGTPPELALDDDLVCPASTLYATSEALVELVEGVASSSCLSSKSTGAELLSDDSITIMEPTTFFDQEKIALPQFKAQDPLNCSSSSASHSSESFGRVFASPWQRGTSLFAATPLGFEAKEDEVADPDLLPIDCAFVSK